MYETKSVTLVTEELHTNIENGLTEEEAAARLRKYGENVLKETDRRTVWRMIFEQLNEPLMYILIAAAAISFFLGEIADGCIILVVLVLNTTVGVIQEGKAKRAMEALKKMSAPMAYVRRNGALHHIQAAQVVPGDIVIFESGAQVPADVRLILVAGLKIEEASLTGESVPVEKISQPLLKKASGIGDCTNMGFMSTNVTYGRGEGIVVATGMQTQIGKIAQMLGETGSEMTPLQKRLSDLGRLLSIVAVILCILLFGMAVLQHRNIPEMLITAISLAVAAVPEGLPAVVTIVLALSVSRMVKINTIVRRLPCVETLGAVSVVCSDKTGTLTQNKMCVTACYVDMRMKNVLSTDNDLKQYVNQDNSEYNTYAHLYTDSENNSKDRQTKISEAFDLFLQGFCLCNDAELPDFGDPTELALLAFAKDYGRSKSAYVQTGRRIAELPFDSVRKMMSTLHLCQGRKIQFTKGSADELLGRCDFIYNAGKAYPMTAMHRRDIERALEYMTGDALRVLALAMRTDTEDIKEAHMTFVGLAGMKDPVRPNAMQSVDVFSKAGVRTVMITGDHMNTALAVARQLHIASDKADCLSGAQLETMKDAQLTEAVRHVRVFSRVSPEHKVRIVRAFQKNGHIVAMTGDGVNDAPSLKAADIGIAMGKNGTDVARSAADMILTDDCFSTIEKAIEEGRGIYANIKKSVLFLLSSNFGEIMTMFTAMAFGFAAPLKAVHILWINLITDALPALALGIDKNDTQAMMQMPPRKPQESLFAHKGLALTLFYGALIAAISLAAFLKIPVAGLKLAGQQVTLENIRQVMTQTAVLNRCQTYAFTVLGMSQLFHAAGMRDVNRRIWKMQWKGCRLMFVSLLIGISLQILVTEIPAAIQVFGTSHLSLGEWALLLILSAVPLVAHEILV